MAEINIYDINRLAREDSREFIEEVEREYHSIIDSIADRISADERIRIVMIAGPSGSGKTTTANLLKDALISREEESLVVSLDDFYRNPDDPDYPKNPDGTNDFESVYALDIPLLTDTLVNIASARPFAVPKYDFKEGARSELLTYGAMPHGCVIIEGLHALSPAVLSHIPNGAAFKLFVSVSTNINKDGVRILSGRKIRFLRRMIRDSIYRNSSVERTLGMWRGVLSEEDKSLYPNRIYADMEFNTFHPYELCVMRPFAEAMIPPELADREEYIRTVLYAARCAVAIPIDEVPGDSLIREFIPGGKYESIY